MADRTNRESQTREKNARVQQWKPPSTLDAPEAPVGYKHRWIRERVMEYDDRSNIHKRLREGYELVRAEEYPDFDAPVIDELVEQRNEYYRNKTNNQMEAIDRDMMRDSNSAMPMLKPERRSQVAFGGKKSVDS
jgi:hypothetical protein